MNKQKEAKKQTLAIIGCGEVGYFYATLFHQANYELELCAPRPNKQVIEFSQKNNIALHKAPGKWLENSGIIISCVPGNISLSVSMEILPFLKAKSILADFSSSSAEDKKKAFLIAKSKKINFVDVVIMGSVTLMKEKAPLLCTGESTKNIVDIMKNIGAPIRELPNSIPGDAASLKLLRTVFMKGLSALAVECVTVAEYRGIKPLFYEILSDMDQTSIGDFLDMLLCNHVIHACRQKNEIAEASEQLKRTGFQNNVLLSVEALFSKTCEKIQENPIQTNKPTSQEAIDWLLKKHFDKCS